MKLLLIREHDNGQDTIGKLFYMSKYGVRYVQTIEDESRAVKVKGETRIPEGFYNIELRKFGKFYTNYSEHEDDEVREFTLDYGILELQNVPGFTDILIHIGNDEGDTAGCILTGMKSNNNSYASGILEWSTGAYKLLIAAIRKFLDEGEDLIIEVRDFDREIERILR